MDKAGKILIVDDDDLVLDALNEFFIDDFEVVMATSGARAVEVMENGKGIDAAVLDIKMAEMDGLETAGKIKEIDQDLPIIFHTGYPGDYSEAFIDKEYQPFDYVIKNERPARLQRAVKNAVAYSRLKKEGGDLVEYARKHYGIVGKSSKMLEIYRTIEKIAPTDSRIIISGPTGSGKELVARAIHKRSDRANNHLAIYNCNSRRPELVEAELFGFLKGSFTGAVEDRMGLFEYADGGTVFLDEIGDLDINTQTKLLRAIETGEIQKIGSPEMIKVDVRVICATNLDLKKLVDENKFREDLYYRLQGVSICLPPLSERREDIPDLIEYFAMQFSMNKGDGIKIFSPAARKYLVEYDWGGNVRELMNTVESLINISASYYISVADVETYLGVPANNNVNDGSYGAQLIEAKKNILAKALAESDGNRSAAADKLRIDRSNFYKMTKNLD